MGNLNCSKCCHATDASELKQSVTITQIVFTTYPGIREYSSCKQSEPTTPTTYTSREYEKAIVFIQSRWKGFKNLRQFKLLHDVLKLNHGYFSREEIYETLTPGKKLNSEMVKRSYSYKSGASYSGQWIGGFRHGKGIMIWSDGSEFIGEWNFGIPAGYGKFIHHDGEFYEGNWTNPYITHNKNISYLRRSTNLEDINDGFGNIYAAWLWLKHESQDLISENSANFSSRHRLKVKELLSKNRQQSSSVTQMTHILESSFLPANTFNFKTLNDDKGHYTGEISNSERYGIGRNVYLNGDIYEGSWKEGYHEGLGRHKWIDGSYHIGYYLKDDKHGSGLYVWDDYTKYIGEFANNVFNGVGEYWFEDGQVYLGEWLDGKMHGFGIFTTSNGMRYEGMWFSGKLHGEAYSVHGDGNSIKHKWVHGESLKNKLN